MKQAYNDVKTFHIACGLPHFDTPSFPLRDRLELRIGLLKEEVNEFLQSHFPPDEDNLVLAADAIADIIYVLIGTALEYGIPLPEVWDEVHRTNMAKTIPEVHKNEQGKVMKPNGWKPPEIRRVLYGEEEE